MDFHQLGVCVNSELSCHEQVKNLIEEMVVLVVVCNYNVKRNQKHFFIIQEHY